MDVFTIVEGAYPKQKGQWRKTASQTQKKAVDRINGALSSVYVRSLKKKCDHQPPTLGRDEATFTVHHVDLVEQRSGSIKALN